MNHRISRAQACLSFIGCTILAGCSLGVPNEHDVFGESSLGGRTSGRYTSTSSGGSSITTAGNSAQSGGSTPVVAVGGSSTGGTAGGTSATASGGAAGTTNSAGGSPVGGGGSAGTIGGTSSTTTVGGTVAMGGTAAMGGSDAGQSGGSSASTGGVSTGGGSKATGGAFTTAGGSVTTVGGSSVVTGGTRSTGGGSTAGTPATGGAATGGAATGGAATGGAATGGAATGGAATGGAATGGAATGGAATGGAATGGAATGGAATGGAPPQAILQYAFEQGSGTTATDSTTNHNDGTLSNVSWSVTGRNGGAVNYAAADSQIAIPSSLLGTSRSLTISAWVNLSANAAENRLFYFGTADGTSYFSLTFNNSVSGISVRFKPATGTEQVLTTPTQLPLGIWKHITVSVSNVGAAMYVDGKIVAQDRSLVMDPTTLGTPMTNFVGSSPTAGQSFQGFIDEFYVYNGILPLSDIRQLAWPKTDYTVYHFEEGTGTAVADSSDRGINGTLTGGATWVPSPFGTGVMLTNSDNPTTAAQQYVTLLDGIIANCTTTITMSAWINLTTNTTDAPVLEFAQSDTLLTNLTTFSTAKAQPVLSHFFLDELKTFTIRQLNANYTPRQWTHIAAVRGDNSSGVGRFSAVYQNGFQKAATANTSTGAYYVSPTPLSFIGKAHTATSAGVNGAVDEVLVTCRQYTDDEIEQLAYLPPPN
jgi:hypothetical protein